MFDTEKFIREVHTRECIWNAHINEYKDKILRRMAWEDIGSIMYDGWESYGKNKKNLKIDELRNKWKHLRDYFVREKNKMDNIKIEGEGKKRRTPFLDMLNFLETLRGPKRKITNKRHRASSPESDHSEMSEGNDSNINLERSSYTSGKSNENDAILQECLLKYVNMQEQNNNDPHMNFLLSILPEMRAMDERKLFEFKFEIMKLIKAMNYGSTDF